jgi:uncharacterized protein YaaN involved in tellurite resistance
MNLEKTSVADSSVGIVQPLELRSPDKAVVGRSLHSDPKALQEIERIDRNVDFSNPNIVPLFATQPMQEYDALVNRLLEDVRVEDAGGAGDVVLGVAKAMDTMRIRQLSAELRPWSWNWLQANLPVIGKYLSVFRYFYHRKQKFLKLIEEMERSAKQRVREILEHLLKSERLIDAVEQQYKKLALHILAGEDALDRGIAEYERLAAQARETGDPVLFGRANALHETIMAFDTRLLRVKIAYAKAPVTGQQIRLSQSAGRITLQNIVNTLDFTLSDLKTSIIQVAGLYKMRAGQAEAEKIDKLEAEVAAISGQMLGETYLSAKKTQGEGIERVKRLASLMETVADLTRQGIELDRGNQEARREAEEYLLGAMSSYREVMDDLSRQSPKRIER